MLSISAAEKRERHKKAFLLLCTLCFFAAGSAGTKKMKNPKPEIPTMNFEFRISDFDSLICNLKSAILNLP